MSNFHMVSIMNDAFGNPKGDPSRVDYNRIRSQCKNILDEYVELMVALGANKARLEEAKTHMMAQTIFDNKFENDLDAVRDGLCDIHVFAYGAHHLMGIDADKDMHSVIHALMSRFIKDPIDQEATIAMHVKKGVYDVYFEGTYPTMIMKSAKDQPDAPKGKFLKSASSRKPVFYQTDELLAHTKEVEEVKQVLGAFDPLPGLAK